MGLLIGPRLQAVFHPAQKTVSAPEFGDRRRRQPPARAEHGQHLQNTPFPQGRLAAAVDQLKRLTDEFDLADAARSQLDVALHALALHFLGDQHLHVAQGCERAVIEITPVHERPQAGQQALAGFSVAGDHPRLDHRVALPVPAVILVVVLEGGERHGERPGIAERPQPQIDPVHETLGGRLGQQLAQPLAEPAEKFLVADRPRAIGLALAGIGENQVDVRGKIEFPPAELAHAQHHQPLRLAVGVARLAVALALPIVQAGQGSVDQLLRQFAQIAERLLQFGQPRQIAPSDARHLPAPEAAQGDAELIFVGDTDQHPLQPRRIVASGVSRRQIAPD